MSLFRSGEEVFDLIDCPESKCGFGLACFPGCLFIFRGPPVLPPPILSTASCEAWYAKIAVGETPPAQSGSSAITVFPEFALCLEWKACCSDEQGLLS
mmetsp:Transcript_8425/g.20083  ORF Transcript_8425/g.20083 Transcript_8425/m.20083 type:complete len:98 (+) Transcript_8425:665-958(+)